MIISACIISFFIGIWVFTDALIFDMVYIAKKWIYYETYWSLYNLFLLLYLWFFPIFSYLSYVRIKKLREIEKVRIKFLLLAFGFFVFSWIFLQVILPLLWIMILEKEIVLLLIPFLLSFWYTHNRYYFSDLSISIWRIAIFLFSVVLAFVIIVSLRTYILSLPEVYQIFWKISSNTYIAEFLLWVILHTYVYKILLFYMLPHSKSDTIVNGLISLKEQIPHITNIDALNKFLEKQFLHHFHISHSFIHRNLDEVHNELVDFFNQWVFRDLYIHDHVFVEDNKNKFNNHDSLKEISKDVYLVFPIRNLDGSLKSVFEVGKKPLGEIYSEEEIKAFTSFSIFLESHLKYIYTYSKIQDLTVSLDKRVDEKTIEYNNLLNKQKEFIAYVGHEIRNPITNSLFLTDSLRDSAEDNGDKQILEDSSILYEELVKVSKLVKHIFSTEKFDLDKVKLYKKDIDVSKFLHGEIDVFANQFPHIRFMEEITPGIRKEIDETQFRQVIHNLLNNAVKFVDSDAPSILITCKQDNDQVSISIEDNGVGFDDIDISGVFDKYSTWAGNNIGLWMGLYLCKKIVEFHNGSIQALNSKTLGGASFSIKI